MAFDIVIQEGFFVVNDTSAVEHIRRPRADVRFTVNNSTYNFFNKTPTIDGTSNNGILRGEFKDFAFADLATVTEDGVIIPIANEAALSTYLSGVISFFFNPDPVVISSPADGLLTKDFMLEVAKGNIAGHSVVIIEGRNQDVDTGLVDIGMEDVNFTWLTTALTLEAISDDPNDTAAGTGARVITVKGLDSSFNLIEEDITMNGTSASIATTALFIRVNRTEVKDGGTYASTSGGSNEGNIIVRPSGGGATQSFVPSSFNGTGVSNDAKYTIPADHIVIVLGIGMNVNSSKIAQLLFQIRPGADITSAPFTSKRVVAVVDGESGRSDIPKEELEATLPEKTDVWATAAATSVNTEVSARIKLLLIDLTAI